MMKSIMGSLILFILFFVPAVSPGDTGSIYATSKPPGANILLDNNPIGKKTDALIEEIPVGPHTIRVEHPEFGNAEERFEVKAGLTTTLQFELQGREPKDAAAYHNRGFTRFSREQLDLAISDFSKAIELDPNLFVAFYNRGIAHFDQGKYDLASFDFTKAIELGMKGKGAYMIRALAYGRNEQYDRAIEDFSKVIEFDPKDSMVYHNRGIVSTLMGRNKEAVSDFQKAMDLDPKNGAKYHFCLGLIYDKMGDGDTARIHFLRAKELDQDIVKKQSELLEKRVLYVNKTFYADGILSASKYLGVMAPIVARAEEILKITPKSLSRPLSPALSLQQSLFKFFTLRRVLILGLAFVGIVILIMLTRKFYFQRKSSALR